MLLSSKKLNVALATTHIHLKGCAKKITQKSLCNTIKTLHYDLTKNLELVSQKLQLLA